MPNYATARDGRRYEVDANGNAIREVDANGNPVQQRQAPAPIRVSGPPPTQAADVRIKDNQADASEYAADQAAAAAEASRASAKKTNVDAQGSGLENQVTAATMPNVIQKSYWEATAAERQAMTANLPAGYMWNADGKSAIPIPGYVAPKQANADGGKVKAAKELLRLIDGPNGLQEQYSNNFSSWNPIESFMNPSAATGFDAQADFVFNKAKALERTPGEGAQSDKDAAAYERIVPRAINSDARNETQLSNLRQMALGVLQEAGEPIPAYTQEYANQVYNPRGAQARFKDTGDKVRFAAGNRGITPEQMATVAEANQLFASGATYEQLMEFIDSPETGIYATPEQRKAAKDAVRKRDAGYKVTPFTLKPAPFDPVSGNTWDDMRAAALNTDLGAGLLNYADSASFGAMQAISPTAGVALDVTRQNSPMSSMAGSIAGGFTGGAGLAKVGQVAAKKFAQQAPRLAVKARKLARANPRLAGYGAAAGEGAAYGGIYGTMTGQGGVEGAMLGALGGVGGRGLASGLGKVTRGVTDPAVKMLTERGVPLTFGQVMGNRGAMGKFANAMESLPGIGNLLNARRMDGLERFGVEAMKDAVAPVGGSITGKTVGEALEQAQKIKGQAYDDALSGVRITTDTKLANDLKPIIQQGRKIPQRGDDLDYIFAEEVGPLFGDRGILDGARIQQAFQTLRGARADMPDDTMGNIAGRVLGRADNAISDWVGRKAPKVMPALGAANKTNSMLSPVEDAMMGMQRGTQGAFTPAQLTSAVTRNTRQYGGKAAAARGDNITPLMQAGKEVLPPTIPNSGTGDRIAAMALPGFLGAGAAGTGTLTDNPEATALLAALAALSTKGGANLAQKAMVSRSPSMVRLGGAIERQKGRLGMFGAGALPVLGAY